MPTHISRSLPAKKTQIASNWHCLILAGNHAKSGLVLVLSSFPRNMAVCWPEAVEALKALKVVTNRDALMGDADGGERFLCAFGMTVPCKCCASLVLLDQDKGCHISLAERCLSVLC